MILKGNRVISQSCIASIRIACPPPRWKTRDASISSFNTQNTNLGAGIAKRNNSFCFCFNIYFSVCFLKKKKKKNTPSSTIEPLVLPISLILLCRLMINISIYQSVPYGFFSSPTPPTKTKKKKPNPLFRNIIIIFFFY